MSRVCARIVVSGVVQGVCFRMAAQEEAIARGVNGWVRNLPNGQVEAVFAGTPEAVEAMLAWAGRGPPGARVRKVETHWEEAAESFPDFRIRY